MLLRSYVLIIFLFPFQNIVFASSLELELETISLEDEARLVEAPRQQHHGLLHFFANHHMDHLLLRGMGEILSIIPLAGSLLTLLAMNRRFRNWWGIHTYSEPAICLRS